MENPCVAEEEGGIIQLTDPSIEHVLQLISDLNDKK